MMADIKEDYAVVVGVSHYQGLKILKGPDHDARAFEQWLVDPAGGKVPAGNCRLILSSDNPLMPVQDSIDDVFGSFLNGFEINGSAGRRLYFYFSGHGLGVLWDETALVLPKWTKIMRNTALSSSAYLRELVHTGKFEEVYFFLDCCRNRVVGANGRPPAFGNAKPAAGTGSCASYIFSATEFENEAFEAIIQPGNGSLDNERTRGIFTKTLMDGLNGAAANGTQITADSLRTYIHRTLPETAKAVDKVQKGFFQFSGDLEPSILVDEIVPSQTLVVINFNSPGRSVNLQDGGMNIIKTGNTNELQWNVPLAKGLYSICYDDGSGETKEFRVDGLNKTQNHEC